MAHLCSLQLAGLREPNLHWTLSFAQARTCHTRSLCSHDGTLPSPLGWQHGAFNGKSLGFSPGLIPPKKAALRVSCSGNPVVAFLSPDWTKQVASLLLKAASTVTTRAHQALQANPLVSQVAPALAIVVFSIWVLGPLLRAVRHIAFKKDDRRWKDSQTRYILSSYLRPVFLWVGVILLCRAFDPVVLSTEASQAIKERFLNFVRSLSTVVAFAYCTASLTQHLQKLTMEHQSLENSRNVGVQFIGNTVYSAVWVAAVCLFMELLGFSTQKWLTAGGLGTVLITLAGREIFTNFLSGVMIHATRPFVENEWIQAKIEGYEVSGTVEQVGWWSPTIIRGEDREALHIPNHKFTVSVVRNLSQKTHWRIKTHLCISHLDVNKIPNIVADMRKVLAKHPQVEQKRLHRRVFLENVDTENQALMILVSCFVKTSHFEEYLRVKEVILLDLLKVISHHRARLSTPIRSMQRISDDSEPRHSPFRDVGSRPTDNTRERPLLLVEASTVVDRKEETKRTPHEADVASRPKEGPTIESQLQQAEVGSKHHPPLEGLDSMGLNSKDITLLGAAFEKPPAIIPETLVESPAESSNAHKVPQVGVTEHSEISIVKSESLSTERSITSPAEKGFQESTKPEEPLQEKPSKGHGFPMPKLDGDSHGSVARPQLEDNLVLGVALDGPKRTLPLNNDTVIANERELVTSSRNGNGTTGMKENSERSSPKPSPSLDSREKER